MVLYNIKDNFTVILCQGDKGLFTLHKMNCTSVGSSVEPYRAVATAGAIDSILVSF